jgi:hypothetical protein
LYARIRVYAWVGFYNYDDANGNIELSFWNIGLW